MPDVPAPPPPPDDDVSFDEALLTRLHEAMDAVMAALDARRRGEIDDSSLRQAAIAAGIVRADGYVWLLDVAEGRWLRYDGLTVEELDPSAAA